MIEIECPWPDRILWPNGRGHYMKKARRAKSYFSVCHYLAKEKNVHKMRWPEEGEIRVHLIFHPIGKPDDDNMEAAFKAGRDGIADAMGVDDRRFRVTREMGSKVNGGLVVCQVLTDPA